MKVNSLLKKHTIIKILLGISLLIIFALSLFTCQYAQQCHVDFWNMYAEWAERYRDVVQNDTYRNITTIKGNNFHSVSCPLFWFAVVWCVIVIVIIKKLKLFNSQNK